LTSPATAAPCASRSSGGPTNRRLAAPEQLDGIELRYPDGRAWGGEGEFSYVRAPVILSETAAA